VQRTATRRCSPSTGCLEPLAAPADLRWGAAVPARRRAAAAAPRGGVVAAPRMAACCCGSRWAALAAAGGWLLTWRLGALVDQRGAPICSLHDAACSDHLGHHTRCRPPPGTGCSFPPLGAALRRSVDGVGVLASAPVRLAGVSPALCAVLLTAPTISSVSSPTARCCRPTGWCPAASCRGGHRQAHQEHRAVLDAWRRRDRRDGRALVGRGVNARVFAEEGGPRTTSEPTSPRHLPPRPSSR